MKPMVGLKFERVKQLKESMIDYSVSNGYPLEYLVNDYKRLLVRCGKEETDEEDEDVRKMAGNNKRKKARECPFRLWASKITDDELIQNPDMSIRAMQTDIMRKYKCKVSTGKCSRAKKKLLYKGIKDGWINGCRRFIGLDGCFLKSVCEGQLLSAIGRDANNHMYPLAWAVVSIENKENWKWFLELLRNDIGMIGGVGLTLISDQHKGIVEAVKDVFPYGEHRQCTRHIYANFKKKACDAFENGMSESFNSRIRKARRKPIITILEEISTYVMRRNFRMATKGKKLEHDVCPTIRKKLEEIKVKQRHWNVIPSDCNQFEVVNEYDAYAVDISARTCSCRSCQLSGIPYVHAVTVLAFLNKDPETYVSDWLKKDMFTKAYNYPIKPLKGSSFWPKIDHIKPLPPNERRVPGRPTVNRKRDPSEKETKRRTTKGGEAKSTTIHIPASPGVLPHFARDDDVGDQMAGQESQTIDEV
ncbi:hypothetical protein Tco_1296686 [Tanacetum coccineum]